MIINDKILKNILEFENTLRYTFEDKKYLLEALTHSSYANEHKDFLFNERLEFLGDSVLSIIISELLFKTQTELPEGELTKLRANVVCEQSLSEVARGMNFGKYILLGKGEEATGGRDRTSILADTFEAILAAIYLDGGIEKSREFILFSMKEIIEDSIHGRIFRDYKTHLQELLQKKGETAAIYSLKEAKGPDHNKCFVMEVILKNEVIGTGQGGSKKEAEQLAAKEAIKRIS